MPDLPYRPRPPASDAGDAIERLAAEGHHRILEARAIDRKLAEKERRLGEKRLRVALGAHYGAPIRVMSFGVLGVGGLMVAAGLLWRTYMFIPGSVATVVGFLVGMNAPPAATRARLASERTWLSTLPFVVEGYFEVLSGSPRAACHLAVVIEWSEHRASPDEEVLRGLLGVLDTSAQIESHDETTFTFRSGSISGLVGTRLRDGLRNTRIVEFVHRLVDQVLVPLHGVRAIARVSLARR
jgi:hypothetical protein